MRPHAFEQAVEEVEVHAADELAVFLGESVERAVRQRDLPASPDLRLVTMAGENIDDRLTPVVGSRDVLDRAGGLVADRTPGGACRGAQAIGDRCACPG